MDPVSIAVAVIAIYEAAAKVGGALIGYRQGVKNAKEDSRHLMDEIRQFQRSLEYTRDMLDDEAIEAIEEGMQHRLQNLQAIMADKSSLFRDCELGLESMCTKLETEVKRAREGGTRDAMKNVFRTLMWPFKKEEVQSLLENLRNLRTIVDQARSLDGFQLLRRVHTSTELISNTARRIDTTTETINSTTKKTHDTAKRMETTLVEVASLQELQERKERQQDIRNNIDKIRDWLKHVDPSVNHRVAADARTAKTGHWFLDGKDFEDFKAGERSYLLWLHGNAGCGKTILSSSIIDQLKSQQSGDTHFAVAYWYFNTSEKLKTSLDQCLRSLITQLIPLDTLPDTVKELWIAKHMGEEVPKLKDLISTLKRMVSDRTQQFFIILDALDEANSGDYEMLFGMIEDILGLENARVRVLVTSRTGTKDDFVKRFPTALSRDIEVAKAVVNVDIGVYIQERLHNDPDLSRWPKSVHEQITKTILEKADGMFRWVECQLQAIRECTKPKQIPRILRDLPETLQLQYTRDLARASSTDDSMDVVNLLRWLAYPQRPITVREAIDMLAVDLNQDPPAFSVANRLFNFSDLQKLCGSLVRVDDKKGKDHLGEISDVSALTTSHTTVQELLVSRPLNIGTQHGVIYKKAESNLLMAETCLVYLQTLFDQDIEFNAEVMEEYPFARFCAEYWDDYYRLAISADEEHGTLTMAGVNERIIRLLDSRKNSLTWIQICDPDDDQEKVNFSTTDDYLAEPIYNAALLGLPEIVSHYIDQKANINFTMLRAYETPLVAASSFGHEKVVNLLLSKGADATLACRWFWGKPLAAAVENNKVDIVRILLSLPEVDKNCRRYVRSTKNIMDRKDRKNQDAEKIYNPNEHPDDFPPYGNYDSVVASESMVYIAVNYNSPEALDVLLEEGADVNLQGGSFGTALQAACYWGRIDMVKKLLAHGARVDIYGGTYGSALTALCVSTDNPDAAQWLIDAGCNINHVDSNGNFALQVACQTARHDTAMLLLKHRAFLKAESDKNIDFEDNGWKWSPYPYAFTVDYGNLDGTLESVCVGGNVELAQALLDHGADVRQDCKAYDNCLQAACENNRDNIIPLFVKAGLSTNTRVGSFDYLIIEACVNNRQGVVQALLQCGADPNRELESMPAFVGWTALRSANIEITKLLLDHGARIDQQSDHRGGALYTAATEGNLEKVGLLIDKGAAINQVHPFHGSALHGACLQNNMAVVQTLYKRGTKQDAVNMIGQNALHISVRKSETRKTLLELGFNPFNQDNKGCNCLHYAAIEGDTGSFQAFLEIFCKDSLNIDTQDNNGWTPLHWAAASSLNSADCIKLLLDAGADRTLIDKQGRTPEQLALMFGKNVETFLLQNLDINDAFKIGRGGFTSLPNWSCDACYDRRGESYKCSTCPNFDLCFRCILDKEFIHFPDHDFDLQADSTHNTEDEDEYIEPSEVLTSRLQVQKDDSKFELDQGIYWNKSPSGTEFDYAKGDSSFPQGPIYFEVKLTEMLSETRPNAPIYAILTVGLATREAQQIGAVGWHLGSCGYHSDDGNLYGGGPKGTGYGPTYGALDTIGCGFDPEIPTVFYTKNGRHLGPILSNLKGPLYPVVSTRGAVVKYSVNFGAEEFVWKNTPWDGIWTA